MLTHRRVRQIEQALADMHGQTVLLTIPEILSSDPDGILEGLTPEEVEELLRDRKLTVNLRIKFT
jgi:hypothetical protein